MNKDISNNVRVDLSGYSIGYIKGVKATLNEGYSDSSGNSLIFYHNNAGTYFSDNGFNSYFNFLDIAESLLNRLYILDSSHY